jgi:DNA-binding NtrC family response regulator
MPRILLIEDNGSLRRVLSALLEEFGHEVELAASTEVGLWIFHERGAELVITDLVMEGGSGLQVVVAIAHGSRPVPVIVTSGADSDLLESAKLLGATAVLQKPFTRDELHAALEGALRQRPRVVPGDLPS